jgi:transcriptional regulator with XRE-family HTH domain
MQDSRKSGAFISSLRKAQNWTQLELADRLNVTHQAVSRWETGSSFPDIATLVRIAELFGVQVDDVLNGEVRPRPVDTQKATFGEMLTELAQDHPEQVARMVSEERVPIEAVIEAGPLTPPAIMDRVINALEDYPFNQEQLRALAPFLGQEVLHSLFLKAETELPQPELIGELAPFFGQEIIEQLVQRIAGSTLDIEYLWQLAPFLSQETLRWFLLRDGTEPPSKELVVRLAPFLDQELIDQLVQRGTDGAYYLPQLAPFLSQKTLHAILLGDGSPSLELVGQLAPFLGKEILDQLVQMIGQGSLDDRYLRQLAPFLSAELRSSLLITGMDGIDSNQMITYLAPFLNANEFDHLVARLVDGSLDRQIALVLAPFLNQEALLRLIESDSLGENKLLVRLAPFLSQDTIAQILQSSSAGKQTTRL